MSLLWIVVVTPVITGLVAWGMKNPRMCGRIQLFGAFVMLVMGLTLAFRVLTGSSIMGANGFVYVDALGAFNLALIVLVGFMAAVYSVGYMEDDLQKEIVTLAHYRQYYLWFHLFLATMLTVSVVNNLGLLWVGIELTTLVSVLLVAFYRKRTALEAAWKYLILGSVGIAFALLGIIFVYVSGMDVLGDDLHALNWTSLQNIADQLNPKWISIAFVLVLVGLGTKAGLAPMHFWLPDAHSEAPSPVSAVMSGVLLNTALFGILRVFCIANITLQGKASNLLLFFGLLSMVIAVPFILVQNNLKRLLAYSSIEHMGIISLGVGIGGPIGLYGAVLHMFNHAMAKALLFFAAGNTIQRYHTKKIYHISGMIKGMPITGAIFFIGILAITGVPPFNVFMSEFTMMMAGFQRGYIGVTVAFLLLIVTIFAGMIYYSIKMVFGEPPMKLEKKEIGSWSVFALFLPLSMVLLFGLYVPPFFHDALHAVVHVLQGGNAP